MLANSDVSLANQNSGVVHRVGELSVSNKGLKSSLHELVGGESENVIELSLVLLEQTESDDSSNQSVTLEDSSLVILLKSEELSCSLSQFGKGQLDSPDLSLVSQSISSDNSKLVVESSFIEGFPWSLRSFPIISVSLWHVHYNYLSLTQ